MPCLYGKNIVYPVQFCCEQDVSSQLLMELYVMVGMVLHHVSIVFTM